MTKSLANKIATMNITELNEVLIAAFSRRKDIASETRHDLTIGLDVKFTDIKSGVVYHGTIRRVKIKNAVVAVTKMGDLKANVVYNVPISMIELDTLKLHV